MLVISVTVLVLLLTLVVKLIVDTLFFADPKNDPIRDSKIRSMIRTVSFVIRCTTNIELNAFACPQFFLYT